MEGALIKLCLQCAAEAAHSAASVFCPVSCEQGGCKAAMSEGVQLSSQSQVHVTQLYEENTNKRPVLTSQPNGLAPLGSARPGPHHPPPPQTDRQTAAATEPAHHFRQSSAASNKSADGKPKPTAMTPEHAMKQFMSKMSSFEHHEVFSYPEGEPPSASRPP